MHIGNQPVGSIRETVDKVLEPSEYEWAVGKTSVDTFKSDTKTRMFLGNVYKINNWESKESTAKPEAKKKAAKPEAKKEPKNELQKVTDSFNDLPKDLKGFPRKSLAEIGVNLTELRKEKKITEAQYQAMMEMYKDKLSDYNKQNPVEPSIEEIEPIEVEVRRRKRSGPAQMEVEKNSGVVHEFSENLVSRLRKSFPNLSVVSEINSFVKKAIELGYVSKDGSFPIGFVDVKTGTVYLNPEKANNSTAMEEFSHLWLQIAKKQNPEISNKGISLVEGSKYHEDVKNDPNYKSKDSAEILDEALARAIRDKGIKILEKENAFTKWLKDFWSLIKRSLNINPKLNFATVTLDGYSTAVAKELLNTTPLTKITEEDFKKLENNDTRIKFGNSLLNSSYNWNNRVASYLRRQFLESGGVGKRYRDIIGKVEGKVEGRAKEAQILFDKFKSQLSEDLKKSKKKINETDEAFKIANSYLNGSLFESNKPIDEMGAKERIDRSKKELKKLVDQGKMSSRAAEYLEKCRHEFQKIQEEIVRELQESGSEIIDTKEIVGVINKNLGIYLHRSYRAHENTKWGKKYKDLMDKVYGEGSYERVFSFMKNKLRDKKIRYVYAEKAKSGEVLYRFRNDFGNDSEFIAKTELEANEILTKAIGKDRAKNLLNNISGNLNENTETELRIDGQINKVDGVTFEATDQQIERYMDKIAYAGKLDSDKKGGRQGASDIMMKRKNLDKEVRMLLGEHLSPELNLNKSVVKALSMLEMAKLEKQLIQEGKGSTFIQPKKGMEPEGYVKITEKDSYLLGGKKGWYTTKEMHDFMYGSKADKSIFSLRH